VKNLFLLTIRNYRTIFIFTCLLFICGFIAVVAPNAAGDDFNIKFGFAVMAFGVVFFAAVMLTATWERAHGGIGIKSKNARAKSEKTVTGGLIGFSAALIYGAAHSFGSGDSYGALTRLCILAVAVGLYVIISSAWKRSQDRIKRLEEEVEFLMNNNNR